MPDLRGRVFARYEMSGRLKGRDGYVITFSMDDSFRSWWAITRWNLHFRNWRVLLRHNLPDLFTRVLWRKLWRRSA